MYVTVSAMMTYVKKTQVYLPAEQLAQLHKLAKSSGRSIADLIREAISRVWLRPSARGPVSLWAGPIKKTPSSTTPSTTKSDDGGSAGCVSHRASSSTPARWIALALDPHHERAVEAWEELQRVGARLVTSLPIVMETFTFLDRNAARDVAQAWRHSLDDHAFLELVECRTRDLAAAWRHFDRPDLHKLSAVDATSFVIMAREELRRAFTFDHHFATAGFQIVG